MIFQKALKFLKQKIRMNLKEKKNKNQQVVKIKS